MSKHRKNRVLGVFFFLLAFLVMIGLTGVSEVGAEQKVLVMGTVQPISGPQAAVGLSMSRGNEIYAEWINSQGGLTIGSDKYKVKIIVEDSGMNPEIAATSATKLVHKDGVKFVIGAIIDPCGEAIYGVTRPAKALHISSFLNIPGGPADVHQSRPLKVRLNIHNNMVHKINYDYLTKTYPNVKTVVLTEMNIGLDSVLEHRKSIAEKYNYHCQSTGDISIRVVFLQVMTYAWLLGKPKGRLIFISKDDLCIAEYGFFTEKWEDRIEETAGQVAGYAGRINSGLKD